ncbi:MAG: class II fructose-bisphosphate aldolase [Acidobacteria bacterium]|nr:MAG: class II fructose-bisphosphate aldolase [Acidobacteriota bacterium]
MTSEFKGGVITGKNYIKLLEKCRNEKYALPAVNVISTSTVNAACEAAAKVGSDIIIQVSNGGAQFFAGKGADSFQAKVQGAVSFAIHARRMAKLYGVGVVLHTDHANRKLLPWIDALLDEGEAYYKQHGEPLFTSHMLDLSEEPLEENIATCKAYLERMAKIDMSLEIELGITGGEEDGVGSDVVDDARLYTQPEDVLYAYEQLEPVGHFTVAASFGNVHGVYKPGNVKLRPIILKNSQQHIVEVHSLRENPLSLVFHGGSGSSKKDIRDSIDYGVFKMNIDTDTQFAFTRPIYDYVMKYKDRLYRQIGSDEDPEVLNKKVIDPRKWLRAGEELFRDRLVEAFEDLKGIGKRI